MAPSTPSSERPPDPDDIDNGPLSLTGRRHGRSSSPSRTTAAALTVAIALGGLGIGAGTAAAAPVPAAPQIVHTNWFSDWQTCIWGVGIPTALAWKNPAKAKGMAYNVLRSRDRGGLVRAYGNDVVSACERFIRS